MIFQHAKQNFFKRLAFSLALILCLSIGIFAQGFSKNSSAKKSVVQPSTSSVKLKKALVIGRRNPILVNPSLRRTSGIVSVGRLNGRAKNLVAPAFAKNFRREVRVQAMIDQAGNVISAKSAEKNLLMRRAAEQAARRSIFFPVVVRGQARKAVGFIVYKPVL